MHGRPVRQRPWLAALPLLFLAVAPPASAQDRNILHSLAEIEARLQAPDLVVLGEDYARPLEGDRSRRVTLAGPDGEASMDVHWKPVGSGGQGFNNEPRYELAAFRLQQLFLDERDYVVPPVFLRAMAIDDYRQIRMVGGPTLRNTRSVLFLVSYWVQNLAVDTVDPFDEATLARNPSYAWHWGNANVLTHLIDHKDSNHGNVLVSMDGANTRVFAVDNDVAFGSQRSDRGHRWSRLLVDRLPDTTIDRLRALTLEDLHQTLGVVAQFRIVDGYLEPMAAGENLDPGRGVRVTADIVQFGLTRNEIRDVHRRIEGLLNRVDRGQITVFERGF